MQIQFLDDSIEKFIRTLEKATIAKVLRTLDLLERFGYELGMPQSKKIDHRLFELRIRGQQEIRIIYAFHRHAIFLLHGFVKKSERIQKRDLEMARQKLNSLDKI